MFHNIDVFLYDLRFAVLILLLPPMLWAVWVYWTVLSSPASPTKPSTKRHSHRMREQKAQAKANPVHGAIALADAPTGSQSNLLDELLADEDDADIDEQQQSERIASEFQGATTQKIDSDLVNKLVNDVTNKVAAQLEALTASDLEDDDSVDMQDLLDTVQEDDDEPIVPEGSHTAAIRKASKMEELGFHRGHDESADDIARNNSVLNSTDVKNLGAKHLARITELGLNDGEAPNQDRLRTAQLDDILNRLDSVLENPVSKTGTEIVTAAQSVNDNPSFSDQSTQLLVPKKGKVSNDITAVSEKNRASVISDHDDDDDEADSFFNDLVSEDDEEFNEEDVTVREESDHGQDMHADVPTMDTNLNRSDDDEDESFNIADIASAISNNVADDEQDELDTVKLGKPAPVIPVDEQDIIETVAVANGAKNTDVVDPNLETIKEEITDDDLPAWARADSFDEDVDDDEGKKPKQQSLFD